MAYATRERHGLWRGADVSYSGAHLRVRRAHGSAPAHTCPCGEQAAEWSYMGGDPTERSQIHCGYLVKYGTDPAYYQPLCRRCHRDNDRPPLLTHCQAWARVRPGEHGMEQR